jgi:hypothetical protein
MYLIIFWSEGFMPRVVICVVIMLLVNGCTKTKVDEESKARKVGGYIQVVEETAARIKYDCPATIRRYCKNQNAKCMPVYTSDHTKKECSDVDSKKIERMCGQVDVVFYNTEKECMDIKEAKDCPTTLTNGFDIKNLYKCPALYKKICEAICGARYDSTDIRAAWQIPEGDYAVVCIDNSNEDFKNGVSYSSDREKHGCYTSAEIHLSAGGTRSWCIKYGYVHNGQKLGAYLQCASRLK